MQIPILIEPIEGGRFRARAGEPFAQSAEAESAQEAARCLEEHLAERVRNGAHIAVVNVPNGALPSGTQATMPADEAYQTDWVFRELQEAIAENRRAEESAAS